MIHLAGPEKCENKQTFHNTYKKPFQLTSCFEYTADPQQPLATACQHLSPACLDTSGSASIPPHINKKPIYYPACLIYSAMQPGPEAISLRLNESGHEND